LKAVILAAGAPRVRRWFPPDSKPKCLYHVDGEVILTRMVRCLREAGVNDIRIIVGYRHTDIEEFNRAQELDLEVIYCPEWVVDAISASIEAAIKGVNDDVLLLFSDIVVRTDVIKAFLAHPEPLVRIKLKKEPHTEGVIENKIHIVKVAREKFGIFDNTREHMKKCMRDHPVYDGISHATGLGLVCALIETFRQNEPVGEVLVHPILKEVDLFRQTDEGKKHWGIK